MSTHSAGTGCVGMPSRDTELAQRCQQGDVGAYAELVHRHRREVYRVARAVMGTADDAEDVAQEAFVRGYQAISQYNPRYEFVRWLRRITVNVAVSKLRQRKRTTHLANRAALAAGSPPSSNPVDRVSARELEGHLRRAIETLSPKQRLAITLFVLEDMTVAETADAIGCSVSAAKAHVHRARRKLAAVLSDYLQEE
jgi:RNA polymerase sigma-70 factor (ECF subfamily)